MNKFGRECLMESRRELIVKYIAAIKKRVNWEGIDKDMAMSVAQKLLKEV
jgi:hypothetical protein